MSAVPNALPGNAQLIDGGARVRFTDARGRESVLAVEDLTEETLDIYGNKDILAVFLDSLDDVAAGRLEPVDLDSL